MFSSLLTSSDQLFQQRLAAAVTYLRGLILYTREDYQAAVMDQLNKIFALGTKVTPLTPIPREGPASVGDAGNNFKILNTDVQGIIQQLLSVENSAAMVYNLFAATQNSLRQTVREQIFQSNQRRYIEAFINNKNIKATTATVDYNASAAYLNLVSETSITPSNTEVGVSSVGALSTSLSNLYQNDPSQTLVWNQLVNEDGSTSMARLELVFTFPSAAVINRLYLGLDTYQGLTLVELTSSPDGNLREDIFPELAPYQTVLDGASSGFSGDCILDFVPRNVLQLRVVLEDRGGIGAIVLQSAAFGQRQYGSTAQLQSIQMSAPQGECWFSTEEFSSPDLTQITHQVSFDGVTFSVITPESQVVISGPFWYRALLQRLSAGFSSQTPEIQAAAGTDPNLQSNFTITNTTSTDLGSGILERILNFSTVSGAIPLAETPYPGTLIITMGATVLGSSVYTFSNNTLFFTSSYSGVQVRYQTSSLSAAGLSARAPYYSPALYQVKFEAI